MKTYLISLFSPDGPVPPEAELARIMADLEVVNADIRAAGGWVFAGGLAEQASATVVRAGADPLMTDGPFVESREHLGGLSIVQSDDYDVVLDWATRIAKATGLPIEVRPFQDQGRPGQAPTTQ
ncbi:hypothetical protein N865_18965 [Intrasporangium oryzae NRRL B-24470]|uniref:YCII-related domain-containing protein n=1 Tax=Intrasporangium oryzae NRRL B-24470 TaxID=1386089 RepID=W9GEP2_9MICO|nr:YciI family protein [Intrasporangium oryzae]EWT03303.1 hypothetical protein N865_18965 [Intrasporangium oryzae NRRL B-24470]